MTKEAVKLEKVAEKTPDLSNLPEEFKDTSIKYNLSKFEYDLYHEEYDTVSKIIRVKRFITPDNMERWKVFENDEVKYTIDGNKLLKKERGFLRTINGVNFLIAQYKRGIKSFRQLHIEIKKNIST